MNRRRLMRLDRGATLALSALAVLIVALAVALGPGDLFEKDQPKTIAYTADVVLNGRLALPRDVLYQPATKPPMYNWIGAIVVLVTRSWGETALKAPSVLAAVGIGVLLLKSEPGRVGPIAWLAIAMFAAFGVDVRHASTMRLAYLARPDMLQAFFVTLAFFAATRLFLPLPRVGGEGRGEGDETRSNATTNEAAGGGPLTLTLSPYAGEREPSLAWVVVFWTAVAAAILTKGPLALLLGPFVVALAWWGGRSLRAIRPIVGSLACAACVGAWFACAWHVDPTHVRDVMLGAEVVDRVTSATPEGNVKPAYYSVMWFWFKGGPIAMAATVALVVVAIKRRRAPAIVVAAAIWLVVLLVGLSLPAGKRMDYLLPTYPPATLLAAWLAFEARRFVPTSSAALVVVILAAQLAHGRLTKFGEAKERWTDHAEAFVARVRPIVKDEALVVIVRGKHPLTTLLGRHQGSRLTLDDLNAARWAILDVASTAAKPTLTSEPLPSGFEVIEDRPLRTLGLYDLRARDRPTLETLIDEQKKVGTWTRDENPYRAPDTVWKE